MMFENALLKSKADESRRPATLIFLLKTIKMTTPRSLGCWTYRMHGGNDKCWKG